MLFWNGTEIINFILNQEGHALLCPLFKRTSRQICQDLRTNFQAFSNIKQPGLKKLVSISGAASSANLGSFNQALAKPQVFAIAVKCLLNEFQLDGIDLDFEPSVFTPQLGASYGKLIRILRQTLGPSKIITLAVAPDQTLAKQYWQMIAPEVNYLSSMCYDFHAPFYPPYLTGYLSNLYPDPKQPKIKGYYRSSCLQSIQNLKNSAVPPDKILLGFPAYGIIYAGVKSTHEGMFQVFDPHLTPKLQRGIKPKGYLQYRFIEQLLTQGFKEKQRYAHGKISAVWAYNAYTQQLTGYDNSVLVAEKARWAKQQGLGGLMVWSINDDLNPQQKNSLLATAAAKLKA